MFKNIQRSMKNFLSGVALQRRPVEIPELYLMTEEEYGEVYSAKTLLNYPDLVGMLIPQKRFQSRVLFPHFGILTPYTLVLSEFNGQFFPAFLKSSLTTSYVENRQQWDDSEELKSVRAYDLDIDLDRVYIVQQYIIPETCIASHLRVVLSFEAHNDAGSVRGAVILYNKNQDEHRSNHRHGGIPIALTGDGSLDEITDDSERGILETLDIDPNKRGIPAEVVDSIFEHRDSRGRRLYNYLFHNSSYTGIDLVFGRPFSNGSFLTQTPQWYFLEVQHGPDNSFLHETKAWIPEERNLRYIEQTLGSA